MRLPGVRGAIFYAIKRISWRSWWELFEQRRNVIRCGYQITLVPRKKNP